MKSPKKIFFILLLFSMLNCPNSFTAEVNIPLLKLCSHAVYDDSKGIYTVESIGEMEMQISGGYKFGGNVILGFNSNNLESFSDAGDAGFVFKSATIAIWDILNLPFSLAFFIGETDILCSGEGFSDYFGIDPIITTYSGFMYFSEGIVYDGIHLINGTGLQTSFFPLKDTLSLFLYLYQDAHFDTAGKYSLDFRTMLNLNKFKLDFFTGATLPAGDAGYYRMGALFYGAYGPGEFLTQFGITRWDPVNDPFTIDLFYILFEMKLSFGILMVTPSFFFYPRYYNQQPTDEQGNVDFNLNFLFGDLKKGLVSGGLESNFSINTDTQDNILDNLSITLSPFLNLITSGVLWEFKISARLFDNPSPYDNIKTMFSGLIGIKAEF